MGDNDFPVAMNNQPVGYMQQYVSGDTQYAQKGDGIKDFATRTKYSQEGGGPLVAPLVAQVSLMDRIKNFLGNFNDLETFKKIEESNQKIKNKAMERNRQREIDDLNKKLRMEQGYGGM